MFRLKSRLLSSRLMASWTSSRECIKPFYACNNHDLVSGFRFIRSFSKRITLYKSLYYEERKHNLKLCKEIGSLESELEECKRFIALYRIRPRIETSELRFMKAANLSDVALKNILLIDTEKLEAITTKILQDYEMVCKDGRGIGIDHTDIESSATVEEPDTQSSNLPNAALHFLRWMYIFKFSTYREIETIRKTKNESEIEKICSDLSFLWILSPPVRKGIVIFVSTSKNDAKFCMDYLEFYTPNRDVILDLLY